METLNVFGLLSPNAHTLANSPVDITEKRGEPGKNSKKAEFGIIRKQIFHRITYPKSSKIHLGEIFYGQFSIEACMTGFRKVDLSRISNLLTLTAHNFRLENGIDLKYDQ